MSEFINNHYWITLGAYLATLITVVISTGQISDAIRRRH